MAVRVQRHYASGLLPLPPRERENRRQNPGPPDLNFWLCQDGAKNAIKNHTEKVMPKGAQVEAKMTPKRCLGSNYMYPDCTWACQDFCSL